MLAPGGVYVLNVIDAPPQYIASRIAATLLGVFPEVALVAAHRVFRGRDVGNLVFVCSTSRPARAAGPAADAGGPRRRADGRGGHRRGAVLRRRGQDVHRRVRGLSRETAGSIDTSWIPTAGAPSGRTSYLKSAILSREYAGGSLRHRGRGCRGGRGLPYPGARGDAAAVGRGAAAALPQARRPGGLGQRRRGARHPRGPRAAGDPRGRAGPRRRRRRTGQGAGRPARGHAPVRRRPGRAAASSRPTATSTARWSRRAATRS